MTAIEATTGDAFAGVVGQPRLVAELRAAATAPVHAYLLVGPPGAGAAAAARSFSAALLCPQGGDGTCRDCRLALAGEHPDALSFVPEGAFLSVADAEEIVRLALRSPGEGSRKVLILHELHRIQDAGPALLKVVEEPPASTVFVILADTVVPELVTVASRCVRLDVGPLPEAVIREALGAAGVDADRAAEVAPAALGDLDRARLLATDDDLARRQRTWRGLPARLDGTGAAVALATDEVLGLIEEAAEPLRRRHAAEAEALQERIARRGERGSGRATIEGRQKRELRRHRANELRFGLATLAATYRDHLVERAGGSAADAAGDVTAIDAITAAHENLIRNPNEALLLQALFLRLPSLPAPE